MPEREVRNLRFEVRAEENLANRKASLVGLPIVYGQVIQYGWRREVIDYNGLSMLMDYSHDLQVIWVIISGYAMEAYSDLIALPWLVPVVRLCAYTAVVNLNLAVFNLIPLPPLDGYHVFNDLVLRGRFHLSERAFRIGMLVVLLLSAQGILGDIISAVVYPAQDLLLMPIKLIWG